MNKLLIFSVMSVLLYWSCGEIDIFADVDNIFDPSHAEYTLPSTSIVDGPSEGATLDTNYTIFKWRHSDASYWPDSTGDYSVPARIYYSYRLNAMSWSPWTTGNSLLSNPNPIWSFDTVSGLHALKLEYLEDREYLFEVRSQYHPRDQENNWPQRSFTVDALQGPAFILSPSVVYIDSGATIFISAWVIDITDLIGIHLILSYDRNFLEIYDYSIKNSAEDFLLQSQVDSIEAFTFVDHDSVAGLFDLNIALAGGNFTGVSGSGMIVQFIFIHTGAKGESYIQILPESSLRDINNSIQLNFTQDSRIVIW